ncbi:uncharacterized protein V6R79_016469 [Siganus canaliculatus]
MPVPAMEPEPVVDHQRRFQAAVDVIQNLPKNGSYRPSYDVMLRFYSLYKQAVCGPCAVPRPGFWDPVGRYKWDAWSRLGEMSSESAMVAYVDEIKKVAQEVIDSIPMNEKTASFFHHFEPLYLVIDEMPRPPESLLVLTKNDVHAESADINGNEEQTDPNVDSAPSESARPEQKVNLPEAGDLPARPLPNDSGISEGLVLTSDSESEIFCDSVDTVEQLSSLKAPVVKFNGFHNGDVPLESFLTSREPESKDHLEARQVGAGQGGEGAEDGKCPGPNRSSQAARKDSSHHHGWRERGVPQGSPRRGALGGGGGGGAGRGGGDGSESGMERLHETQLQQQIIVALQRLREDMRSVMERLEVVERLVATHTQGSEWRPCLQCAAAAPQQEEEKWWPFEVSGQTVLLFLLWPFIAQGLVFLLKKAQKRRRISS